MCRHKSQQLIHSVVIESAVTSLKAFSDNVFSLSNLTKDVWGEQFDRDVSFCDCDDQKYGNKIQYHTSKTLDVLNADIYITRQN